MKEEKNELIRLAVIDDGINENLYDNVYLDNDVEINSDLIVSQRVNYDPINISHGTMCAAIIKKYSSCNRFTSIKILSEKARGSKTQLVRAIEWCIEHNINLINLSLGSIDYRDYLDIRNIINCAYNRGIIIVAACSNKGIFTYPASLSNVIGVKCDNDAGLKFNEYIYNVYAMDGIEITANSKHYLIDFMGNASKTFVANSFAAPVITALVYNMMISSPDLKMEDIKEKLLYGSKVKIRNEYYSNIYKNIDWAEKSVVFIINSESGLCDLSSCCIEVYDTVNIHSNNLSDGLKNVFLYIIKNRQAFYNINTIVIINENENTNVDNKERFYIERISKSIKNIIYIENNYEYMNPSLLSIGLKNKIWHPSAYKYYSSSMHLEKETEEIQVPIVIIYDFIGRQLNTMVYNLSEEFRKNGYSAVSASDNSIGVLYKCEVVQFCDRVSNFDNIDLYPLKVLEKVYNPDIIICGIDAINMEESKLLRLMKNKQVDVNVIITCDYTSCENYLNKISDNGTELLVLLKETDNYKLNLNARMFNYLDEKLLSKLYSYLIFCLQKD